MEFKGVKLDELIIAITGLVTAVSGLIMHLKGISNSKKDNIKEENTDEKTN